MVGKSWLAKFQHTAARRRLAPKTIKMTANQEVSTHSRPKAAGEKSPKPPQATMFQHTAARRRLAKSAPPRRAAAKFQHTAARRRLGGTRFRKALPRPSFNTQPPEGGWAIILKSLYQTYGFQHTAARRRLVYMRIIAGNRDLFQHTAARRRLGLFVFSPNTDFLMFQHTAARRRLVKRGVCCCLTLNRFNTQPPEGGWG